MDSLCSTPLLFTGHNQFITSITNGRFCCAGLPFAVTDVLEVCEQVFALWLLLLRSYTQNDDAV